ncbi:hypothetical protein [Allohahella marinimesophila]|uniref:Uncharacterized protein n=1 Tax=Allohahella marinimesophila TaxID=1054972 RepID=A0ABP7PH66_9GAMM
MMSQDNDNEEQTPGTARTPQIIKGGCGIRFDPDQLSDETGFDFSGAEKLKEKSEDKQEDSASKDASDDRS